MKNRLLTLLVNPHAPVNSAWGFFKLQPAGPARKEGVTEAAARDALHLREADPDYLLPILLAFGRHEWSRWIVQDETTYQPEWRKPDTTVFTGGYVFPLDGKTVWPPRQTQLPLHRSVTFTRSGASTIKLTFDTGEVLEAPCQFDASGIGRAACRIEGVVHCLLVLEEGAWVTDSSPMSATYACANYPWKKVEDELAAIPGILDMLNSTGMLEVWHASASPVERVTAVCAALVKLGLST